VSKPPNPRLVSSLVQVTDLPAFEVPRFLELLQEYFDSNREEGSSPASDPAELEDLKAYAVKLREELDQVPARITDALAALTARLDAIEAAPPVAADGSADAIAALSARLEVVEKARATAQAARATALAAKPAAA
jgi:hypothetical protein